MSDPAWEIDLAQSVARLQFDQLSTQVSLDQPYLGWQASRFHGQPVGLAPGQIWLTSEEAPVTTPPAAMHVRGSDVIASYPAREQYPCTAQIYRGVQRQQVGREPLLVMSTLISLNTHLLDARPTLSIRTPLPAECPLLPGNSAGFAERQDGFSKEETPTALLLRPNDSELSYLELWHTSDFQSSGREGQAWVHRFQEPLEKGVIRRLLIWSILLPRPDDLLLAADLQQTFAQTAPPLTT